MRLISKLLSRLVNCSEILIKSSPISVKQNTRNFSITYHYFQKPIWGSKKSHRKIKIQSLLLQEMADPKIEETLAPLRAAVKEQVSVVGYNCERKNR